MGTVLPFPRAALWYRGLIFDDPGAQRWAMALDRLAIPWLLDPGWTRIDLGLEAPLLLDQALVPTFWLPASQQHLHIVPDANWHGRPDVHDLCHHFVQAQPRRRHVTSESHDMRLIVGDARGNFRGFARTFRFHSTALLHCHRCGGTAFFDPDDAWTCPCCGAPRESRDLDFAYEPGRLSLFPEVDPPWRGLSLRTIAEAPKPEGSTRNDGEVH